MDVFANIGNCDIMRSAIHHGHGQEVPTLCCEDRFLQQLRERGFRLTPQREMVLHILHDSGEHATAEEIYAQVSTLSAAVDLSTVYRTLELLEQFHLVASFDLGDGERRYELLTLHRPHYHLHCRGCGTLITLEAQALQPLLDRLTQAHGFSAQIEHWVIPGLCQACQAISVQTLPSQVA
jgi:Fur family transcriptional regulator, ferric uptake regulator